MKTNKKVLVLIHSLLLILAIYQLASKQAFAKNLVYTLTAEQLMLQDTGLFQTNDGLVGVNVWENQRKGKVDIVLPIGNQTFDIKLYTVSENLGGADYKLYLSGKLVGEFTAPTTTKQRSQTSKNIKIWRNIELSEGETLSIEAINHTNNGKDFSKALWQKIEFLTDAKMELVEANTFKSHQDYENAPAQVLPRLANGDGAVNISGELKTWHRIDLILDGPYAHELDVSPNPFLDYNMSVSFTHESNAQTYTVPGYFAGDANAAESSVQMGNKWIAHFAPTKAGKWFYQIAFSAGQQAAISAKNSKSLAPYHGITGEFIVSETDKTGRDFRAKGKLAYVGQRYLRFAHSKQLFIKAGADAPETLLAYADFDGTQSAKHNLALKTYAAHAQDAKTSDPTWQNGKGKNLLGALNYLSSTGANAISFLTYNAGGDGDNVWPYVSRNAKYHFDVSKLAQWQIVFEHAQSLGLFLHFKLQENESDDNRKGAGRVDAKIEESLDGGLLGIQRKLYIREMVARFAHLNALNWNLGEENTQSSEEIKQMASYLSELDAYNNHIVIHTFPSQQTRVYPPLLGANSAITGASLQNHWGNVHELTLNWLNASISAGKPWVVCNDEQNPAGLGVPPDPGYQGFDGWARQGNNKYNLHQIRKYTLWGNLMAGGAGVEYYFGYRLAQNDLLAEDFRSRHLSWIYAGHAINFFADNPLPLNQMVNRNELVVSNSEDKAYILANQDNLLLYLPEAGSASLDLRSQAGVYRAQWFNPVTAQYSKSFQLIASDKHLTQIKAPQNEGDKQTADRLLIMRKESSL
ncbi:signal peptide protein [Catenovulum agarivorans DS-2]|uniref:Signal peptide protein n=1 Tax=Catenovulum agarivorans DS-2 TaxID=1328313 RepID=W7QPK0_9ALTE|nr:DUF5060 domain-containing protein [Catenovulum agarivorans]EWH09808.1 signal peptide protein [Catenovulum agarivorans DS-2]